MIESQIAGSLKESEIKGELTSLKAERGTDRAQLDFGSWPLTKAGPADWADTKSLFSAVT